MSDPSTVHKPYPELTLAAILLGAVLGIIMTAAFVYVGLKLGFGLGGSTVAAILGFVVLRSLGSGTIIENNVNQTIASAINVSSSGVIFTLPALLLMGEDFSWMAMVLSATAGSFLGVVLIIPLRKQMLEFDRLRFPSGMAVASILRSPGGGKEKAVLLGIGAAVSAAVYVLVSNLHLLPESLNVGSWLGITGYTGTAIALSIMNIGAGMLSGKGGLPFVFGGVLAWWIIAPLAVTGGYTPDPAIVGDPAVWGHLYGKMLRPVGIGILIGGALAGVIAAFPAIRAAVKTLSSATKMAGTGGADELSARTLGFGLIGAFGLLYAASALIVGPMLAIPVALAGSLWLALAGLIVAQATGMTDISPLSGMALIGVTLMLAITGGQAAAAVLVGVAVCVGVGQCADMMQDLKTGWLVGATPRRQVYAQLLGVTIGSVFCAAIFWMLIADAPIGSETWPAPAAVTWAGLAQMMAQGSSALPRFAIIALGIGTAIGIALPIAEAKASEGIKRWLPSAVGLGVAMVVPFIYSATIFMGSMAYLLIKKRNPLWIAAFAGAIGAGGIAGEGLAGVLAAFVGLLD